MNTQLKNERHDKSIQLPTAADNFDFDRWAVEVRRQLLTSLNKRTVRQPYSPSN